MLRIDGYLETMNGVRRVIAGRLVDMTSLLTDWILAAGISGDFSYVRTKDANHKKPPRPSWLYLH